MSRFSALLGELASGVLRSLTRSGQRPAPDRTARTRSAPATRPGAGRPRPAPTGEEESPGRRGPGATREIDPAALPRGLAFSWEPVRDGDPDPGEVVWTWVPYEEHDGRGKDRPVLLVARQDDGRCVGIQLTSKAHDGAADRAAFEPVGTGGWDPEGRPSWARLDRVFLVSPDGMRREGSAIDEAVFRRVTDRLRGRWGR